MIQNSKIQPNDINSTPSNEQVEVNERVNSLAYTEPNDKKPVYAPYTKEEDNPHFKKILKEFLSLVKKEEFQAKWDKRYEDFDVSKQTNEDLKDILNNNKSKFIHDNDKEFIDRLITNLDDKKVKVAAMLTKRIF